MNSLLIRIIIIAYILYKHQVHGSCPSDSRKLDDNKTGYCSIDQIKPGGEESCGRIRTDMIDYTPPKTSNKFGWKDYVGLGLSFVSVGAPLGGGGYVAFTNLFNNVALSYGLMNVGNGNEINTASEFSELAMAIDDEINRKISLLTNCLEHDLFKTLAHFFDQQVGGFITDLKIIYEGIENGNTLDNVEKELDALYTRMTNHADVYSLNEFGEDYEGLKYEILAPSFDYFIHIFSEYTKFYLSIKNAFCNDIEYQQQVHPNTLQGSCKGEFNHNLLTAKTKIDIMQDWIEHGVQRIYEVLNDRQFLKKNCDTSSDYMQDHLDLHNHGYLKFISHIHAMDGYAEGLPKELDIDDDHVCLYFKMVDDDDRWCESDYFLCKTHSRLTPDKHDAAGEREERLDDQCIDAINEKACDRQKKLKDEINKYHNNLIKKYVTPVGNILNSINGIQFTNEDINGVEDNLNDLEFFTLEGYQCDGSIGNIIPEMQHGTVEECRQKCLDLSNCIAFVFTQEDQCAFRGGQLKVPFLYHDIRACYIRIDI